MKYFLKLIRNIALFLLKQIVGTIITIAIVVFFCIGSYNRHDRFSNAGKADN